MALEFDPNNKELAEYVWKCFIRAYKYEGWAIILDQKYQEERLRICRGCPEYDAQKIQCKQCGCPLGTKTMYGHESCPIGKWKDDNRTFVEEKFPHMAKYLDHELAVERGPAEPTFPENPKENDLFQWNFFWWAFYGGEWISIDDPLEFLDSIKED